MLLFHRSGCNAPAGIAFVPRRFSRTFEIPFLPVADVAGDPKACFL